MTKDLTPRERSTLLVLRHATAPLTAGQILELTGYKSEQPLRASLRFLVAERVIAANTNAKGEATYLLRSDA